MVIYPDHEGPGNKKSEEREKCPKVDALLDDYRVLFFPPWVPKPPLYDKFIPKHQRPQYTLTAWEHCVVIRPPPPVHPCIRQYCMVPGNSTVLAWIREIRLGTSKFPILTGTGEKYQQNNTISYYT